jgi:secreted trypsin-like serine protease
MDTKTIRLALLLLCITITEQKTYPCDSNAPCGCSLNSASINARVVNGETAGNDTWSWAASLRIVNSICGGAIISDSYIMTAAHCVTRASAYNITAYVGSTGLFRGQPRSVSRIYSHPQYYKDPSGGSLNDIALLKLSTPLNMADQTLAKVCLPKVNVVLPDNTDVIGIGWGTLREGGVASQTLQQVTMQAINSTTQWCKSAARNMTTQFCAGIMPNGGKGQSMYSLTKGEKADFFCILTPKKSNSNISF